MLYLIVSRESIFLPLESFILLYLPNEVSMAVGCEVVEGDLVVFDDRDESGWGGRR